MYDYKERERKAYSSIFKNSIALTLVTGFLGFGSYWFFIATIYFGWTAIDAFLFLNKKN